MAAPSKAGFHDYYAATADAAPRRTLLAAVAAFPAATAGFALDLGCGTGRDSLALLRRGWRVFAIDAEPDAIAVLRRRVGDDPTLAARLDTTVARLEAIDLPAADLVNSSFALPLVAPADFAPLWRRVRAALKPGGRFAGQLFGPRDSWATPKLGTPPIAIHDRADIDALLAGLVVEMIEEEEADTVTPRGDAKRWHIFHLVARRPPE